MTSTAMRACVFGLLVTSYQHLPHSEAARAFTIDYERQTFLKDGKPFRFVGGAMHYFRVPRPYWDDRLRKLRMGGLNVVDFYIDWSGHEPEPGQYNFRDNYDLAAFLEALKKADLLALVRPGPFVCGEIDNAGFPYWLVRKHPHIRYRTMQREYTREVEKWFNVLFPKIVPYLYKNGGPIILVQLENEYGHLDGYCDPNYMEFMLQMQERLLGKDVVMFRSDSPVQSRYDCDWVRDVLVAGNCYPKTNVSETFGAIRRGMVKPGGPILVPEYYTGWMDYWGYAHNKEDPRHVIKTFEEMMDHGANVVFYMYHGGTSFGFKAGTSNTAPLVSSYDYGAPLAEDGDPRPYYYQIRRSISKYMPVPKGPLPRRSRKLRLDAVRMNEGTPLDRVMRHFRDKGLLRQKQSTHPMTFEEFGLDFGFMVYKTRVQVRRARKYNVTLHGLRDRAHLSVRQERHVIQAFTMNEDEQPKLYEKVLLRGGEKMSILVENMGREDFGPKNKDPKGIRRVTADGSNMTGWVMEAVPVTRNRDVSELMRFLKRRSGEACKGPPCFYYGSFVLPKGQARLDTFLDPSNYTKGIAFVNGINLGRYWPAVGPQVTLYVPAVFLRPHPEENNVIMMEIDQVPKRGQRGVSFANRPRLEGSVERPRA
ncbi:beta-galactosidase-1-like protein [Dermacentor silvarum]|nr:beta-galactosidase-1-like protein [Dermacentor silvarum]